MIVLGTRGSPLALAQARAVVEALARLAPGTEVELRVVQSEGDLRPTARLTDPAVDGWFTSRLQAEVLGGGVDAAVHSAKDLPTAAPAGLAVAAYLPRADPSDVIVTRSGAPWLELPQGARVATSSPRRAAQLTAIRPDLRPTPVRGNVQTRLASLAAGAADALVLAAAGLQRLRLQRWCELLDPVRECTPAPAQGAIAVEALEQGPAWTLVRGIDHRDTREAVEAERDVLRALGGGCQLALGALAELVPGGGWRFSAAFAPGGDGRELRRVSVSARDSAGLRALLPVVGARLRSP